MKDFFADVTLAVRSQIEQTEIGLIVIAGPGFVKDHFRDYKRLFDSAPAGVTHLLLHPSVPGSDIEAITDSASHRIADYRTFLQPYRRVNNVDTGRTGADGDVVLYAISAADLRRRGRAGSATSR